MWTFYYRSVFMSLCLYLTAVFNVTAILRYNCWRIILLQVSTDVLSYVNWAVFCNIFKVRNYHLYFNWTDRSYRLLIAILDIVYYLLELSVFKWRSTRGLLSSCPVSFCMLPKSALLRHIPLQSCFVDSYQQNGCKDICPVWDCWRRDEALSQC